MILQKILFPDDKICTEEDLYFRRSDCSFYSNIDKRIKSFSDNSKNYDNNCYLSDAISEILNIPQKNCDYSKQLKVINIGTGFQFQETLLQHGSEVVDFAKTIGISIAVSILAVILLILYMNYSD